MLETELNFLRPTYNDASREDFNKLFNFYYLNKFNNIELRSIGIFKGGTPGNNTYAFYNANIIELEDILEILAEFNRQQLND